MRTLQDKVVAITGAGSGIGRQLAVEAAGRGAHLALSDWDEAGLAETARLLGDGRGAVRTDRVDVRDRQAVHDHAAAVRADFGRVNVIVNNAGVSLHGDFTEVAYADFEWVIDVNLWGVVHGTKAFLPHLLESGDGHVVNVSSLFGLVGVPGQTAYNAAKFAVRGFTESLRQEMLVAGHAVQVTCVHPGGVATSIVRNGRTTASHSRAVLAQHFEARLARTSAERAAEVIWTGVLADRPRVLIGTDARLLDAMARIAGAGYQRVFALSARRSR